MGATFLLLAYLKRWLEMVALAICLGVSRIYLGVHYPTDVAAGYAAGSMWLAFCISLLMWWEKARVK